MTDTPLSIMAPEGIDAVFDGFVATIREELKRDPPLLYTTFGVGGAVMDVLAMLKQQGPNPAALFHLTKLAETVDEVCTMLSPIEASERLQALMYALENHGRLAVASFRRQVIGAYAYEEYANPELLKLRNRAKGDGNGVE